MSISPEQRILAFSRLGELFKMIADVLETESKMEGSENETIFIVQRQSSNMNPWFTRENIAYAFRTWSLLLNKDNLNAWLSKYKLLNPDKLVQKKIAVINAGNIPLVGFHDFLCVLMSGHQYLAKNASDDSILLPYVASLLTGIESGFKERICFTEKLSGFDAVIATGSNNSARYFNYYFGKYPHIIRKNRNSVAILNGKEDESYFNLLSEDIFRYYGLGCRNVSKLFVPVGYNFDLFFQSIYSRSEVMQHNKYMNNFEHHNAVLLLKLIPFLQNGFLVLLENPALASPVAVLNFEYYTNENDLKSKIGTEKENIQCIVSNESEFLSELGMNDFMVKAGMTQKPGLAEYADGVDTLQFLIDLKED